MGSHRPHIPHDQLACWCVSRRLFSRMTINPPHIIAPRVYQAIKVIPVYCDVRGSGEERVLAPRRGSFLERTSAASSTIKTRVSRTSCVARTMRRNSRITTTLCIYCRSCHKRDYASSNKTPCVPDVTECDTAILNT